jgi:hypothetical protein
MLECFMCGSWWPGARVADTMGVEEARTCTACGTAAATPGHVLYGCHVLNALPCAEVVDSNKVCEEARLRVHHLKHNSAFST